MTATQRPRAPIDTSPHRFGFPLLRIVPPVVRIARRPHRMVERQLMCYRRTWPILLSGFFEPLFYLLSIRVGLSRPRSGQ